MRMMLNLEGKKEGSAILNLTYPNLSAKTFTPNETPFNFFFNLRAHLARKWDDTVPGSQTACISAIYLVL
jgi:hypothetical protein